MTGNITPETDALVPQFLNGGEVPDIFAHCRKLEQERDEAREKLRMANIESNARQEIVSALKERDEAREKYDLEAVEHMLAINKICNERDEAIEKHRFAVIHWQIDVAKMQRERDDALNQIQGWENKWKVAVDMAAIAENKVSNLEDQLDLAMKVIKRLETNQP